MTCVSVMGVSVVGVGVFVGGSGGVGGDDDDGGDDGVVDITR